MAFQVYPNAFRILPVVALLGFIASLTLLAGPMSSAPIDLASGGDIQDITAQLYFVADDQGADSPEALLARIGEDGFQPLGDTRVRLGYTQTPHWFRFTVIAPEGSGPHILELTNAQLLNATLYIPTADGGYRSQSTGLGQPVATHPFVALRPNFELDIPNSKPTTCYLQVHHHGVLRFQACVMTENVAQRSAHRQLAFIYLLGGALFGLAFYNLCLFRGLRQGAHGWLFFLLLFSATNMTMRSGALHLLLWTPFSAWTSQGLIISAMTTLYLAIGFSMSYLRTWEFTPRLARIATFYGLFGILLSLLGLSVARPAFYAVCAMALGIPFLIGFLAFRASKNQNVAPVSWFIVSWGFVLVGIVIFVLVYLDVLPANVFTLNYAHVATLGASLIWAFTLTRHVKQREREHRDLLEHRVAERTASLKVALDSVRTLEGLLPVCCHCKNIRDEDGVWYPMETYVSGRTDADFSHGICPTCARANYPQLGY